MIDPNNQPQLNENEMFKDEPICHSGCSVYRKDYQSLKPNNWLRSQAIHIMLTLIQEDYINKISQKGIQKVPVKIIDPFITSLLVFIDDQDTFESLRNKQYFNQKQFQYLIFPVNTEESSEGKGSHWYLLVYNTQQNSLIEYDSTGDQSFIPINGKDLCQSIGKHKYKTTEILKDRIQSIVKFLYHQKVQIKLGRVNNTPKQTNIFDCGVFTIAYAQEILKHIEGIQSEDKPIQTVNFKGSFQNKREEYLQKLRAFILKSKKT